MNCADVYAVSSASESGPIPAIEAFACGVPLVSTDVGIVRHLIKDGHLGRIVAADEMQFAQALVDVLTAEDTPQLRQERRKIADTFDWRSRIAERVEVLNEAVREARQRHGRDSEKGAGAG
jgi:glycosyltransferase involved in cell wall biosynthesis